MAILLESWHSQAQRLLGISVYLTSCQMYTIYASCSWQRTNSKCIKDLNVRPETINLKLLLENIGRTLFDINWSIILFHPPPRVTEIKTKVKKWDLIKLKSLLHSKGNYKQDEKTTLRMGENNCKWKNWQRLNLQNIQAAHSAQY